MHEDIFLRDLKLGLLSCWVPAEPVNPSFKSLNEYISSCMLRSSLLTFPIVPKLKLTS